ncbi:MAG: hypothetical protein IKN43_04230, partial [Selenomonadaceae bacterium]|nr:hypothetical protein [Selenomonadaceae bacterium]
YFNEYEKFRGKHLSLGIEVGLTKERREDNIAFVNSAPFDQVIGSIHVLRAVDLYPPDIYGKRENGISAYRNSRRRADKRSGRSA